MGQRLFDYNCAYRLVRRNKPPASALWKNTSITVTIGANGRERGSGAAYLGFVLGMTVNALALTRQTLLSKLHR